MKYEQRFIGHYSEPQFPFSAEGGVPSSQDVTCYKIDLMHIAEELAKDGIDLIGAFADGYRETTVLRAMRGIRTFQFSLSDISAEILEAIEINRFIIHHIKRAFRISIEKEHFEAKPKMYECPFCGGPIFSRDDECIHCNATNFAPREYKKIKEMEECDGRNM